VRGGHESACVAEAVRVLLESIKEYPVLVEAVRVIIKTV
jgi:hypothetical protein